MAQKKILVVDDEKNQRVQKNNRRDPGEQNSGDRAVRNQGREIAIGADHGEKD